MADELWRMSAVEVVARLRKGEISPLELVEASAQRIAEVEPAVNALPTLCFERGREHARRICKVVLPAKPRARLAGFLGWLYRRRRGVGGDRRGLAGAGHRSWRLVA